jgi:phosphoribosyl 1,2-cyclic phosphate phosphodiesterase
VPLRLIIRTDGAARGNPGPASLGAVLIDASLPGSARPDATPLASISEALGRQTNNVAEWTGVLRALDLAAELGAVEVTLLLDSKLVVEQLSGRWRVKDAKLAPLHEAAMASLRRFRRWSAGHVPRAQNSAADALANEALDRVAVGGPAVVVRRPEPARPAHTTQLGLDLGDAGPAAPSREPALEAGFDPGDAGPAAGRLRVRVLGSGTSLGIPRLACDCDVCLSTDRHDRRLRASVLLAWGEHRVLIDCGPDFRQQALAANLRRVDAVLLTHEHQDAIGGLDELRCYNDPAEPPLPVCALEDLLPKIVTRWDYAFDPALAFGPAVPRLRPVALSGPFEVAGRRFIPIPVWHGNRLVAGFRTGGFAYCSDVSRIDADGRALLRGLDTLLISALRYQPHPTHQTVGEAMALIADLRPRRAFLTHLDHELGHAALSAELPPGVEVAFDGLELEAG